MNKIQLAQVNNTLKIGIGDLDYFEEITELEDVRVCGGDGAFNSALQQQKASQEQNLAYNIMMNNAQSSFSSQLKAQDSRANAFKNGVGRVS